MFASAGEVVGIVIVAALAVVGIVTLFASRFIKIVQQGSVGVVKRLGEFKSVDQPGLHILDAFHRPDGKGRRARVPDDG